MGQGGREPSGHGGSWSGGFQALVRESSTGS